MPRRVHVIRHVAFEDLGLWEAPLQNYGTIRYFQAGVDDLSICLRDQPELLVVLGGPIGVYETDQYPFLDTELSLIRQRLQNQLPTLGICLGAQLIAAAAGARVYPSGVKEIGWGSIKLTAAGESSCLRHLVDSRYTVLHWHGDTFDLPQDAELLASTELVKNQAFVLGRKILALQFHVEADPGQIESWLIGHTCELGMAKIRPSALRSATAELPIAHRLNCQQVVSAWLAELS